MYAIVEVLGQQFKVEAGRRVYVHRMETAERGSQIELDKVLLIDNEGNITVGAPVIEGAKVGGQAVLGRQYSGTTPWLTERHGYDPT